MLEKKKQIKALFLKKNRKVINLDKYSEKIVILCKEDKNSKIETCTLEEIKNQL